MDTLLLINKCYIILKFYCLHRTDIHAVQTGRASLFFDFRYQNKLFLKVGIKKGRKSSSKKTHSNG